MRKNLLLTLAAILTLATTTMAQKIDGTPAMKYRRSSLHTIIVESEKFPHKDTVLKAYYNAPFPDKYNNHALAEKSFNPLDFPFTDADRAEMALNPANKDTTAKNLPLVITKYLKDKKIANQLVAKWFNRQEDGSFDMNLIGERGSYDATEMQANIAKGSARGVSSLSDAGVELIGNTFVVVTKFNFVSNEATAAVIRAAALVAAAQISNSMFRFAAEKAADIVYNKTKEGYSVWTTSNLYKLNWNDSIEAVFYNELWMDKNNLDPKKKEAFDNTNLFSLEYIGDEKAVGLVTFSLRETRTEDQIISLATVRTVDAVYAKLQKKYDVFKPKVPLYSGEPITAKIGLKEGLEKGDKFEVYEQTIDAKTGLTKYVSKGTIKVDEDLIWDNRFNAADGVAEVADATAKPTLDRTTFKGGKNYYSGMLIKQIK